MFLASCGVKVTMPKITDGKVDRGLFFQSPELKSYTVNFINIAQTCYQRGPEYRQLRVRVVDRLPASEGESPIATCTRYSNGLAEIEFLKSYYEEMDHTAIRRVMFHEMGHCYLGKDHSKNDVNSFMYPTIWTKGIYDNYDEQYMDELFGKESDCNLQQFNEDIMNDPYVE
jgi:hypothetical protein